MLIAKCQLLNAKCLMPNELLLKALVGKACVWKIEANSFEIKHLAFSIWHLAMIIPVYYKKRRIHSMCIMDPASKFICNKYLAFSILQLACRTGLP